MEACETTTTPEPLGTRIGRLRRELCEAEAAQDRVNDEATLDAIVDAAVAVHEDEADACARLRLFMVLRNVAERPDFADRMTGYLRALRVEIDRDAQPAATKGA